MFKGHQDVVALSLRFNVASLFNAENIRFFNGTDQLSKQLLKRFVWWQVKAIEAEKQEKPIKTEFLL